MLSSLQEFLVALTYPLTLSFWLLLCGAAAMLLRWRRLGGWLLFSALGWSSLWSIPQASDWLRSLLESRYPPVMDEASLPKADAIVVLGGGSRYAWLNRRGVTPEQLENSRLAAGARAWLAGRAPVIILSGGGEGGASEARMMAMAIGKLGVPPSVLILEERSRSTRDNAQFTAALAERHGLHHVLLITSSLHMPRASMLFREAGVKVVPVPVPERAVRRNWRERWLPSRNALWRSGRALKEIAGLAAVHLLG